MVNRVSFALRTAKDTNEMLPILLGEIKSSIDTDTAAIWMYDSEIKELIPQAISGWLGNLPKSKFKPNEGIIGEVFSSGLPHLSNKLENDPISSQENKGFLRTNWSGLAVPIRTSLETIGVIMIAMKHPAKDRITSHPPHHYPCRYCRQCHLSLKPLPTKRGTDPAAHHTTRD